ncbi:MAG: ankyrin repeat domain-containing protein, partial [Betaproteobacteria bacterium]
MLKQLFDAIRQNDATTVDNLIVASPALLSQRDDNGISALTLAAYAENKAMVERLRTARGIPDFFEAVIIGELPVMHDALADGQNINERAPDGFTALGLAVFFRQPEAARLLMDADADVNAQATNATRVGPIHAAAARQDIATLELLLYRGANPNAPQQQQVRPIHVTAQSGNTPMTALLLMFGADASLASGDGKCA